MQQTEHYQLSKWDSGDRIQREDFNSDNEKVDAALKAQKDELVALTAAVALSGNCQIYSGSYTGNGVSGSDQPCSHTFPRKPLFVCIIDNNDGSMMQAVQGATTTFARATGAGFVTVAWSGNTMRWYASSDSTQMNEAGHTFTIVALMNVGA